MITHDSRDLFYRTPFGAVSNGTTVILRLKITDETVPSVCRCNIWQEGYELELDMSYNPDTSCFECDINAVSDGPPLWYYFVMLHDDGTMMFYGARKEGTGGTGTIYMDKPVSYQITVYDSSFRTPAWWREGPVYHIFVDRFRKSPEYSEPGPDSEMYYHEKWDEEPLHLPHGGRKGYFPDDIFGGNLNGIIDKLEYISSLGVKTIYLSPVFKAHSNHKYDTADYSQIDPSFGTNGIFTEMCEKARSNGMRVILDGVFSHTGDDSIYFNKYGRYDSVGAYQSKESQYYSWFSFDEYPDKYNCWWDFPTMPTVDKTDPGFRKYINGESGIVRRWLANGSSGWRLDVADELPMNFLRELRAAAKAQDPDSLVIGEVWEDSSNKVAHNEIRNYCYGDTLDSVMNYPARGAILDFMTGKITAGESADILWSLFENYPSEFTFSLMNLLGSHDRPRMRTVLSKAPGHETLTREDQAEYVPDENESILSVHRVKCAAALLFTMPGVPYIYYGDEAGMTGMTDPFNRKTYPWGRENNELVQFFKKLGNFRKDNEILIKGTTGYQAPNDDVLGCIRIHGSRTIMTFVNRNPEKSHDVEITGFRIDSDKLSIPPLSYKTLSV